MKIPLIIEEIPKEKLTVMMDMQLKFAVWECSQYVADFICFLRSFDEKQRIDFEHYRQKLTQGFICDCLKLPSHWQKPITDFIDYGETITLTPQMVARENKIGVRTLGQKVDGVPLLNPELERGVVLVFNGRIDQIRTITWLKNNWNKTIKKAMDGYYPRHNKGKKDGKDFGYYLERRKYLYKVIRENTTPGKRTKNGIYHQIMAGYSDDETRFGMSLNSYNHESNVRKYYKSWKKMVDEYEFDEQAVWKIWARNKAINQKLAVKKVIGKDGSITYLPVTRAMSNENTNQANSNYKLPDYSRENVKLQ